VAAKTISTFGSLDHKSLTYIVYIEEGNIMIIKSSILILSILFIGQSQTVSDSVGVVDSMLYITDTINKPYPPPVQNAQSTDTIVKELPKPHIPDSIKQEASSPQIPLNFEHSCKYTLALNERARIDSLYRFSNKLDSISSKRLRLQADSALIKWRVEYPAEARIERSSKIIKAAGTLQIVSGVLGFILTIVDANMEEKVTYTYPEPIINSRGVQTGTNNVSVTSTVKHKWTMGHKILSFLSGGLFVSGIITVNF
jgi:hypothetical protein